MVSGWLPQRLSPVHHELIRGRDTHLVSAPLVLLKTRWKSSVFFFFSSRQMLIKKLQIQLQRSLRSQPPGDRVAFVSELGLFM